MCIASVGQTGRYFVNAVIAIPVSSISGTGSEEADASTGSRQRLMGPIGFFLNTLAVVSCLSWWDLWKVAFNTGIDLDRLGLKPENLRPARAGRTPLNTPYSRYELPNITLFLGDSLPGQTSKFHEEKLGRVYITGKEVSPERFYPYLGMDILGKFDLTRLQNVSTKGKFEKLTKHSTV